MHKVTRENVIYGGHRAEIGILGNDRQHLVMEYSCVFKHVKGQSHKGRHKTMDAKAREFGGIGNTGNWANAADIK